MPRQKKNPDSRHPAAGSRGLECQGKPRPHKNRLAVHSQEGAYQVRLQTSQKEPIHAVKDLGRDTDCSLRHGQAWNIPADKMFPAEFIKHLLDAGYDFGVQIIV
jgi:hypothetical protein